jgi:hypothetical protein
VGAPPSLSRKTRTICRSAKLNELEMATLYSFTPRSTRPSREITPRDRFVIADALACYVAHQQQSCDAQSWQNELDACALLHNLVGEEHIAFFAGRYPSLTVNHVDQRTPQTE